MGMQQAEEWRDVIGWPGYRVSNLGSVQTKRHRNGLPADTWRNLKPGRDGRGYPQVRLYRAGSRPRWRHVHILVLEAFAGPRPNGSVARHVLTNDPADCRFVNLAWGTQVENMADKFTHGTAQTADRRRDYLTTDEAAELFARFQSGETLRAIATAAGLSYNTVQQAVKRTRARIAARNDSPAPNGCDPGTQSALIDPHGRRDPAQGAGAAQTGTLDTAPDTL